MDSWGKGFGDDQSKAAPTSAQHHKTGAEKKPPSSGELMSSAKILMDAAVSNLHKTEGEAGKANEFNKAKLAAAADDVLEAAQYYGKTDETGYGKYVEKAHDYVHKYGQASPNKPAAPHKSTPPPSSDSSASSEGNYGDYLGKAEGFLSKYMK